MAAFESINEYLMMPAVEADGAPPAQPMQALSTPGPSGRTVVLGSRVDFFLFCLHFCVVLLGNFVVTSFTHFIDLSAAGDAGASRVLFEESLCSTQFNALPAIGTLHFFSSSSFCFGSPVEPI